MASVIGCFAESFKINSRSFLIRCMNFAENCFLFGVSCTFERVMLCTSCVGLLTFIFTIDTK